MISHSATIAAACDQMSTESVASLTVVDDAGLPIGVLTHNDIESRAASTGLDLLTTTVADVMSADVAYMQESTELSRAMERSKQPMTPAGLAMLSKRLGLRPVE